MFKFRETNKLFYNKYLYAGVFRNSLAPIFMDKTLVNTRITLDTLHTIRGRKGIQNCIVKEEFLHDLPLWMHESLLNRHITQAELNDATTIYKVLNATESNFSTRVVYDPFMTLRFKRNNNIRVYTNDYYLLKNLETLSGAVEMHAPNKKFETVLDSEPNVVLCDKSNYKYKIRLNYKKIHPNFLPWYSKNTNKVKMSYKMLQDLRAYGRLENRYLYVKDDHTLTILNLLIEQSMGKIYKLVCKTELDK